MRDYSYKVEYKSGKKNVVVDLLSRPIRLIQNEGQQWLGKSKEELKELQRSEGRWREMIEYLEGSRVPRARYPRAKIDQFALEDEILYLCKKKNDETVLYLLVVPKELRKAALELTHEKESAHLGQHKTILRTEELFYWPNLKKDVRKYVGDCVTCQKFKIVRGLKQKCQELHPVNHPLQSQHRCHRYGWRSQRPWVCPYHH